MEICMREVTDFRRPYRTLQYYRNQLQPNLKPLFFFLFCTWELFPGIEILTFHRHEFSSPLLAKYYTNSWFQRRWKIRGDAVYWFVLQTSLKMAKIPIFAHLFHCFRVLFERTSPFRVLDTIVTDRKIAEKSISCPQYFISRFPHTLKLTKYKILKRTMGLQTGYFKNAAEVYLSEMTRHAPVTLLLLFLDSISRSNRGI